MQVKIIITYIIQVIARTISDQIQSIKNYALNFSCVISVTFVLASQVLSIVSVLKYVDEDFFNVTFMFTTRPNAAYTAKR